MILSAADQALYPISSRYIRRELPKVVNVPVIRNAIATTGQLNTAQLTTALRWGSQPTIRIAVMASCASFTPTPGNNTIQVSRRIFVNHEAGRGRLVTGSGRRVAALGVNILHEMVHWGDNLDGVDRPGEEGDEFEQLVYRANLSC